jgi:hypothetical protein
VRAPAIRGLASAIACFSSRVRAEVGVWTRRACDDVAEMEERGAREPERPRDAALWLHVRRQPAHLQQVSFCTSVLVKQVN